MATNPYPCSGSVSGWGATLALYNNSGASFYDASNNGGSYFKHQTATSPILTSAETIYIAQLADQAMTGCQQIETMGGQDTWYCQLSTETGGGGFVQGGGTGNIAPGDTAVVAVGTSAGNGIALTITSYPSGTNVGTFQLSAP